MNEEDHVQQELDLEAQAQSELDTFAAWQAAQLKPEEFLDVVVSEDESIPPDSNPFHYDACNMGTPLTRGWIAMHAGFDNKEHPRTHDYIILINTRSGQRIRLTFKRREG